MTVYTPPLRDELIATKYADFHYKVANEVRAIIGEALGADEEEVELKTRLIEELDAESLDFLDIVFRLERSFGIKIPQGEIEGSARGGLSDGEFEENGMITPKGLEALGSHLLQGRSRGQGHPAALHRGDLLQHCPG